MNYAIEDSTLINYDFLRIGNEENLLDSISSRFNLEEIPEEEDMLNFSIGGVSDPGYSVRKFSIPQNFEVEGFQELFLAVIKFENISNFRAVAVIGKPGEESQKKKKKKKKKCFL